MIATLHVKDVVCGCLLGIGQNVESEALLSIFHLDFGVRLPFPRVGCDLTMFKREHYEDTWVPEPFES